MRTAVQRAVDAAEVESPKLTIDLAKIFGFTPVSLEIPLPKLSNPFTDKTNDPLALPFKHWRIKLRGWRDGRRGLPHVESQALSAYEDEIVAHRDKKVAEIEKAIHEHRLTITQALKFAESHSFNASDAVSSIKNRFQDWLAACAHNLRQGRDRHAAAKTELEQKEKALDDFVAKAGLKSRIPPSEKHPLERVADIILAALFDIFLGFWFISEKSNIDTLQAFGFSCVVCLVNITVGFIVGHYTIHRAMHSKAALSQAGYALLSIAFISAIVMANLMFAAWRDLGRDPAYFPFKAVPLSAFSLLLLVLNLGIFVLTILKALFEFHPAHPGHRECWREFATAEKAVDEIRAVQELQLRHMRLVADMVIEHVRSDAGSYMTHLRATRANLGNYIANLKAHFQYWPRLIGNVDAFAASLVKLYREHSYSSQRRRGTTTLSYPSLPPTRVAFSMGDDEHTSNKALAILADSEKDLKQFQSEFETAIVPMVRRKIEDESQLIAESHAPSKKT